MLLEGIRQKAAGKLLEGLQDAGWWPGTPGSHTVHGTGACTLVETSRKKVDATCK